MLELPYPLPDDLGRDLCLTSHCIEGDGMSIDVN